MKLRLFNRKPKPDYEKIIESAQANTAKVHELNMELGRLSAGILKENEKNLSCIRR